MQYLIGVIAVLLGGFIFERNRRQSAESLLTNADSKKEVQDIEANKEKNNASLQLEEDRRNMIKEKSDEEKTRDLLDADLLDFFNKSKK